MLRERAAGTWNDGVRLQLATEQPRRPWSEQVLPYGLAEILLITPSRWTLTDASRVVRLPATAT